jgi:serine protease Do
MHMIDSPRLRVATYKPIILMSVWFLASGSVAGQTPQNASRPDALHQLNESVEALVQRVSPSVVQILVTGYSSTERAQRGETDLVIGRERAIGSGVIVDSEGYILTNAHVLNGAEKIEVIVPPQPMAGVPANQVQDMQGKSFQARKVGVSREIDLAVIKIEAHGLPALTVRGTTQAKQGELVFAFGSPEGLRNTVTMGVVSAIARQPDPDSPLVYIQTDAPINPGNSGGPLVNTDGELLGINTFILTTSGGNQGLGFAIPAGVLAFAYPQLLKYGHIHQPEMGAIIQTITPELAAGLQLQRDFGIIVSDVSPGGPADTAGLRIQDIILSVDGTPTGSLPLFTHSLYMHGSGERARVEVLRGSQRLQLNISLIERPHKEDSLIDIADPEKNAVRRLGIIGIELNLQLAQSLPELRIPTGVIVAAMTEGDASKDIPLQTGDVIHGLNGTPITTLAGLREALAKVKTGDAVALQLERLGQLIYVSFTL